MFATVNVLAALPNPNTALLAFAATTIFDAMRLQRTAIPTTVTFADALQDYFLDAAFAPQLDPLLTPAVNTALDQSQPQIGLGRNDVPKVFMSIMPNPLSPRFAYVTNDFDGTVRELRLCGKSALQQYLGVHNQCQQRSADADARLPRRGRDKSQLGDGGPVRALRLCGECRLQHHLGVHDHGQQRGPDAAP